MSAASMENHRPHGALPEAKFGLCGRYKMTAINAETGEERALTDWFWNLITNIGLDRFATADWQTHCQVGSGTNTPAVTDTSLQTLVASTSTQQALSQTNSGAPDYYVSRVKTYRFAQGAAAGNLSEVGIGWSAGAGTLFSRARILDGSGNPTTITVLSNEFLDVTYELRTYPVLTDSTFDFTFSSVTYSCVMRFANVNTQTQITTFGITSDSAPTHSAYNGAMGAVTSNPSGTASAASSVSTGSYTNGNYYRDLTVTWSLSAGNLAGGITAIRFGAGGSGASLNPRQVSFSPAIAKDSTKTLTITYRVSWARKTLP